MADLPEQGFRLVKGTQAAPYAAVTIGGPAAGNEFDEEAVEIPYSGKPHVQQRVGGAHSQLPSFGEAAV